MYQPPNTKSPRACYHARLNVFLAVSSKDQKTCRPTRVVQKTSAGVPHAVKYLRFAACWCTAPQKLRWNGTVKNLPHAPEMQRPQGSHPRPGSLSHLARKTVVKPTRAKGSAFFRHRCRP